MRDATNASERDQLLETAFDWLERTTSHSATQKDYEALEDWLAQDAMHEAALERARTYSSAFDHLTLAEIDARNSAPLASERARRFLQTLAQFTRRGAVRYGFTALAVACFGAVLLGNLLTTETPQEIGTSIVTAYETGLGEQRTVSLVDGSTVFLDSKTIIEVETTPSARTVRLSQGAALFDVTSDPERPFSVVSNNLTATVRGTQFDVRNNGGVQRVSVAEGIVDVSFPFVIDETLSQLMTRQTLEAGEQIMASSKTGLSRKSTIDPDQVAGWRDKTLSYHGATMSEIIADANRYSERPIIFADFEPNLFEQKVSGSFQSDDIGGMLSMLALTFPVSIEDSGTDHIILRREDPVAE